MGSTIVIFLDFLEFLEQLRNKNSGQLLLTLRKTIVTSNLFIWSSKCFYSQTNSLELAEKIPFQEVCAS